MAKEFVCTTCHFRGKTKTKTKGSFLIELILWLCFLVPGLIYSLWRMTSGRQKVCPKCGNSTMIPIDSPAAQKIINA